MNHRANGTGASPDHLQCAETGEQLWKGGAERQPALPCLQIPRLSLQGDLEPLEFVFWNPPLKYPDRLYKNLYTHGSDIGHGGSRLPREW